jgi:hypothetical protein
MMFRALSSIEAFRSILARFKGDVALEAFEVPDAFTKGITFSAFKATARSMEAQNGANFSTVGTTKANLTKAVVATTSALATVQAVFVREAFFFCCCRGNGNNRQQHEKEKLHHFLLVDELGKK